jgi:hypothetical protein
MLGSKLFSRQENSPSAIAPAEFTRRAAPVAPGSYTLTNLLPFIVFGWLLAGVIAAVVLRARGPPRLRR